MKIPNPIKLQFILLLPRKRENISPPEALSLLGEQSEAFYRFQAKFRTTLLLLFYLVYLSPVYRLIAPNNTSPHKRVPAFLPSLLLLYCTANACLFFLAPTASPPNSEYALSLPLTSPYRDARSVTRLSHPCADSTETAGQIARRIYCGPRSNPWFCAC